MTYRRQSFCASKAMKKFHTDHPTTFTTETMPETAYNDNKRRSNPVEPVTAEGMRPQKRYYRQRAHCNPLSHNDAFGYPQSPAEMDWTGHRDVHGIDGVQTGTDNAIKDDTTLNNSAGEPHYPNLPPGTTPNVLDIGCGFGGLTMALATLLPTDVILGMEIRAKVSADDYRQVE